jgi:hypothetical protein
MGWTQEFLRSRELVFSGTKDELRGRVEQYLREGAVQATDLVALLDSIEGWGDQHVYLYTASEALLAVLSDETRLRRELRNHGSDGVLNRRVPLIVPAVPTLSTVDWSAHRVRFLWVEKRLWRDRSPEEDREDGTFEFDAYQVKESRGVVSFSCDLVSGTAELLIQRLPSGNNYLAEKTRFETHLGELITISGLECCPISRAIKKIDEVKRIRKRSSELSTALGYRITYTSRSRKDDVYSDPDIRKARRALGKLAAGRLGNFYMPTDDGNPREIHVKLYAKDQRVGIFGECTETEVRYVLSEVRRYCR